MIAGGWRARKTTSAAAGFFRSPPAASIFGPLLYPVKSTQDNPGNSSTSDKTDGFKHMNKPLFLSVILYHPPGTFTYHDSVLDVEYILLGFLLYCGEFFIISHQVAVTPFSFPKKDFR
jgi:hypothetical protein